MRIEVAQRIKGSTRAFSSVAIVAVGSVVASCGAEDGPDISTPEAACQAVADTLDLLASDDPATRGRGVAHAEQIWVEGNQDEAVSWGMRRNCATDVLAMLDASGVPRTALDARP